MEYKICDLMNINRGASPRPIIEYLTDSGYRWLKISDFSPGDRYVYKTKEYIKEEGITKTKFLKKGTLILTNSATPGIPIFLGEDMCLHDGFLYFQNIKEEIISKEYLYYWFIFNRNNIVNQANGSVFKNLKKEIVMNLSISLPSLNTQKKVVKILDSITRKIETNNQTNDNLYELGDALYKEYYSKYENELPNGYKYLNLNEVSVNFDSKRKPMSSREREQHKGIYPYYGATSIIDYVDDYIFDDTYLLMGEDGTVKTNEGYPVLQYIWGKSCINNHTHVLQGTIISTEHLMFALRKKNIETLITGAVQPKINQENMNKIKIIIATDDINIKFEEQIKIIVDKIKFNSIENITLTQLRNTLLPKLMNGKIDLNKIEV